MDFKEIKYNNVQESFGMGGPYIGELEFKGKLLDGKFLADNKKLSLDKSRVVFSKYVGSKKTGLFGFKSKREFKILIYDEPTNSFYQSKESFEALAIKSILNEDIVYHIAFHLEIKEFERHIKFNDQNFIKICFKKSNNDDFDKVF
ncbi:hypothetical protein [Flavobacterium channae]|uniref:hypothetical protein n=1 Tax=Flavobacterium channae TaxID=2897181 RepID=UPI001E6027F8|nr:hypothetical protein [Flavobacterium channae]UGS24494.1 hypothetical protein LOS89_04265 [Flavobacterium channae]